ncbi:unnamed protein product [Penicillium nalgiovense]|uniref:Uncharacterized protein n=1 Tax=Penicillium nalgiovense TaxID=60175 RepID=A0A1V6Y753_PENNA|nr:hypothetical protein PENNAL_c0033G07062 [Penicillium nalgiovense]CAG7946996.1 unnamed protein product [Penicillium nalgiovense]CAG7958653.1 unnamed protein product [Penicillium nalgiovense]CAG7973325.1 unnamed protein product [Penicillium nalgiovense]CAG8042491.1 unnamed protein product [Penicillium nalgiovense]
MKSFAFSAAVLASTAMALPANLANIANIPSGTTDALPSGVPSCLPSGVIPSGIPLPVVSMIPTCPGAAASSAMSGLPIPTGAASGLTQGAAPGQLLSTLKGAGHGQVLSILNQAGTSNIKMMAESELQSLMSKLPVSALEKPVGQVIQTADSVDKLHTSGGPGLNQVTAILDNGNAALIQLTNEVVKLLDGLGLGQVGGLIGSIVGGLETVTGYIKRDALQNVLSITDVNGIAGGKNLLAQVEPTLLGLLGGGLDLSTVQGPVGNVVAMAPSVSELKSKIPNIPGADFIAVTGEDKASVLLVKLESTVQSLLSSLGLGSVGTTVGSIVSSASSAKGALPL